MVPVSFKPFGATTWIPLDLTGEPLYSDADPGGFLEAYVPCEVPRRYYDVLESAMLRIEVPGGPWFGVVDGPPAGGQLHAYGWQSWLDDLKYEALYQATDLTPWVQNPSHSVSKSLRCQIDAALLRVIASDGQSTGTAATGFVRRIPLTTASRVAFTWKRPATAYTLELRYFTWTVDEDTGSVTPSSTVAWSTASEGSTLSGTEVVDIAASHTGLYFRVVTPSPRTPSGDESCYFKNVKVFGVAGVTATTPGAILNDLCDRLPAHVLPPGPAYRAFIDGDATDLGHLVFPPEASGLDVASAIVYQTGYVYGWRSRIVNGSPVPVPVYTARSLTPDYFCVADGIDVIESVSPTLRATKGLVCRVLYEDEEGQQCYVDVTDADGAHSMVRMGVPRTIVTHADTTSKDRAIAVGMRVLADVGRSTLPGEIIVKAPIQTATGAIVEPCEIESGRIIQCDKTRYGTAVGRIVLAEKLGRAQARLVLESAPLTPRRIIDQIIGR